MTSEADHLLRVAVSDVDAYDRFFHEKLMRIEGISHVNSKFALRQIKYTTALPIDD